MIRYLPTICALWGLSEIVLGIVKRSKVSSRSNLDRYSLAILWITISISITAGLVAGISGHGLIRPGLRFISTVGIIVIFLGLIIRWFAIITLSRYFTVDVAIESDHKLVKAGPYRYVRHPAYSGSLISFLGLGIAFSNWISLAIIFIPILCAFLYRIGLEEKALTGAFGDEYREYISKTWKLLPGLY